MKDSYISLDIFGGGGKKIIVNSSHIHTIEPSNDGSIIRVNNLVINVTQKHGEIIDLITRANNLTETKKGGHYNG